MKYYYEYILDPYIKSHIFGMDNCLLIYDKVSMHITDEIRNLYNSRNKQLIEIPNGLTSIIQPLDVSINYSFKNAVRNKYMIYIIIIINDMINIFISNSIFKRIINTYIQWLDYRC